MSFSRRGRRNLIRVVEALETRRFLHAGHDHAAAADATHQHELVGMLAGLPTADGHVAEAVFRTAYPQYASANLWSPAVFNPSNSTDVADWLYDPHFIEQDVANTPPGEPAAAVSGGPEAFRLPDLVPLTSNNGNYLNPFIDSTEIPGHNLLRFTTGIGNQGTGPAILRSANTGTPPAGSGISSWINTDGTQNVIQQLYSYNGSTFALDSYRPAGRMVWHSGHGHFHLEGYASYRLLTNVNGQPGPVAKRVNFDNADAVGDKVGFCLVNINDSFIMTNGQSSSTLSGYDPVGSQSSPSTNGQPQTTCGFLQGIHVGHADVYSSIYDGQWIDVTGVPNGSYFLEVTLDALNVIAESDEANNTVVVPVTLNAGNATGGTILPDRFEPNNEFGSAADLGELGVQTQSGLTVHVSGESDYFSFTAASTGPGFVRLTIADRDVNLYLYDQDRVLIGSSTQSQSGTSSQPRTETVNANFVAGQTYFVRAVGFGSDLNPTTSAISANYALSVNVNPTVNAATPDASAAELGLDAGTVRIARNGPTSSPLTVNIAVSGTASRGLDYEIYHDNVLVAGNSISIGNEASIANLEIRPLTDALVEAAETVIITVNTSSAYVVGGTAAGTVSIADTPPQVTGAGFSFGQLPLGVYFDFSLDVSQSLDLADIAVVNLATSQPVPVGSIVYGGERATFGFGQAVVLPDGNYRATLSASGVTHALGAPLPGDAVLDFFVFAGDFNRDRSIDIADFSILAGGFGAAGGYAAGDANYDGQVDIGDFSILASKFNTSLPSPARSGVPSTPASAAKAASAMPPAFGSSPILDEPSLWDRFAEPQPV